MATTAPLSAKHIRETPFLRQLPADALGLITPHIVECTFKKGEAILTAGAYCDGAYYLLHGQVESREPVGPRAGEPTRIGSGEIFGEGSALTRFPNGIDVQAATDVSCLLIRTAALRAMADVPELASFKTLFDTRYRDRALRHAVHSAEIFAGVDERVLDTLAQRAELLAFKPGAVIATEGEPCDAIYLVRGGYVQMRAKAGAADAAITYARTGDWVGETSLLLDEPWPFSLLAIEHVELVKWPRKLLNVRSFDSAGNSRLWQTMVDRLKQRARVISDPASQRPLQFAIDSGLIHGESVLLIDLEKCTRCDECVRACADTHDGIPRFVREGIKFEQFMVPTACYHCTDPVCMIGCPTGAITRPLGTFEVAINEDTCIGCGNCVRRCPWGNIHTVPNPHPKAGEPATIATKCDLCYTRPEGPACVQMCPQGCAERVNFKDDARVRQLFAR